MQDTKNVADILNDLIKINNDRVEGYEKAIDELEGSDSDLRALYNKYATQSNQYVTELTSEVTKLGEEVSTDTTISGKIYRGWMSVKSSFSSDERKSTLELCEFGEDAAQKAYKDALEDANELPPALVSLITKQKAELKEAHDKIKMQRDMHVAK
jgi:uncharacterized protein (TIGR02284 family)